MWLVGGVSIAGENWKVQDREGRGSCYPGIQPICPPGLGLSPWGLEPFLLTSTRFNSRPAMAWHRACMHATDARGWLGTNLSLAGHLPTSTPRHATWYTRLRPVASGRLSLSMVSVVRRAEWETWASAVSLTCQVAVASSH